MLAELTIHNFALLEDVHVEFGPGLNVLTGETGAGKSIVIDAIGAVLGSRASVDVVRTGSERATVEAFFRLAVDHPATAPLRALFESVGIDDDFEPSRAAVDIILAREVSRGGRSVARLNGRAVPVSTLAQVGEHLIDIHGQHEHLSLLRPAAQRDLLDRFGGLMEQRVAVAALVRQLRTVRSELQAMQQDEREIVRRIDLLSFQVEEIQSARLQPGEEDALTQEQSLLVNAARLAELAAAAHESVAGGEGDQPAALDLLGRAARDLAQLTRIDPSMQPHAQDLADATALLEELGRSLRAYQDAIEFSPARLEELSGRLELIRALQRKYGATIDEVLDFGERAGRELEVLANREAHTAALEHRAATLEVELARAATALSGERAAAGARMAGAVGAELAALRLRGALHVALTQEDSADGLPVDDARLRFDESGIDTVEFRFAPNPGEPARSVARTASGGELSRLLLALKAVLSSADQTPALIFDEVDAGIGGRNGQVVGEKLAHLAEEHQVLCVTHLPQIAAYGDQHYLIAKQVRAGRTATTVTVLDVTGRTEELAQMLGGPTAAAREQARQLQSVAEAWKQQRRSEPAFAAPTHAQSPVPAPPVPPPRRPRARRASPPLSPPRPAQSIASSPLHASGEGDRA
jgi:DNA repair protein RecN (Recombination protein N)